MWSETEFLISFDVVTGERVACAKDITDYKKQGRWSGWVGSWAVNKLPSRRSGDIKIVISVPCFKPHIFKPTEGVIRTTIFRNRMLCDREEWAVCDSIVDLDFDVKDWKMLDQQPTQSNQEDLGKK